MGDWLIRAIENKNVLTLSREYFQLRKPLERRLYELARKHCGKQEIWRIGLDKLQHKTGSTSSEKEFKRLVKLICKADEDQGHMPDYQFRLHHDVLVVTPRLGFKEIYLPSPESASPVMCKLAPDTYDAARQAAPSWDVYYLEREWRMWMSETPKHPDAAFVGFCRKWYERRGRAQ